MATNTNYGVITGQRAIGGTIQGQWNRGLSAFDLAKLNGYSGSLQQWLESLKGVSPVVESVEEVEGGLKIVLTDKEASHELFLPNGQSITISNTEETEEGTIVTFSDETQILIPPGRGEDGQTPEFSHSIDGVIYWRYKDKDQNWKELVNLGTIAKKEYTNYLQDNPFGQVVETLPTEPVKGVIYVLKEDDIYTCYTLNNSNELVKISAPVSELGEVFPDYIDAPVKNAKGPNEEAPVELNTLDYGTYTLTGYYKTGEEGTDILSTDNESVQVTVTRDQVTNERIVKYETIEDGELWLTILTYDEEGNFVSQNKKKVNSQYWDEF